MKWTSSVAEIRPDSVARADSSANLIAVLSFSPIVLSQYFLKPFHYLFFCPLHFWFRCASQVQVLSAVKIQLIPLNLFNPVACLLPALYSPFLSPSP